MIKPDIGTRNYFEDTSQQRSKPEIIVKLKVSVDRNLASTCSFLEHVLWCVRPPTVLILINLKYSATILITTLLINYLRATNFK